MENMTCTCTVSAASAACLAQFAPEAPFTLSAEGFNGFVAHWAFLPSGAPDFAVHGVTYRPGVCVSLRTGQRAGSSVRVDRLIPA